MSRTLHDPLHITHDYDYIVLSPHFDDALLSCGGTIAVQADQGRRTLVLTVCTAIPANVSSFSSFAHKFHELCGLEAEEVVTRRQREDVSATKRLGADRYWCGCLDAIYRHPDSYNSYETIFGEVKPEDELPNQIFPLIKEVLRACPHALLLAPAGVGFHVDHQLVHQVADRLANDGYPVSFYEDFPYAHNPGALERRMQMLGIDRFQPCAVSIHNKLEDKIDAISMYTSQLIPLFNGEAGVREQVIGYAAKIQSETGICGERFWRRI